MITTSVSLVVCAAGIVLISKNKTVIRRRCPSTPVSKAAQDVEGGHVTTAPRPSFPIIAVDALDLDRQQIRLSQCFGIAVAPDTVLLQFLLIGVFPRGDGSVFLCYCGTVIVVKQPSCAFDILSVGCEGTVHLCRIAWRMHR